MQSKRKFRDSIRAKSGPTGHVHVEVPMKGNALAHAFRGFRGVETPCVCVLVIYVGLVRAHVIDGKRYCRLPVSRVSSR